MSLTTVLLALAPAIAARFQPKPDREVELEARVKALEDELDQMRHERDALRDQVACEGVEHAMFEQYRRTLGQLQAQHFAQAQQQALAQYANQQYANAYHQGLAQQQLGLAQNQWHDCTCVPGRAAAFARA